MKGYLSLSIISIFLLCSFSMDVEFYGSSEYTPVLMERADFEQAIKTLPPRAMTLTSRIAISGTRIYIVEQYAGIHVVDNSSASNPVVTDFINIPGCVDMVIKGNILYSRSAVDLVAIDISNISEVTEVNRVKETFPELGLDFGYYSLPYDFQEGVRPDNTVIVSWETK